ncbi:lipoprotein N-acyltransferase Lnb domain-containing protein [Runella slithyformis]|uniref:DUF4105 domain-containing protein n=1 Tax=Runella slithyformis (strain ATCC 29530 / DSM 19594 / LMG 11500 / NCIMB 11436 / LSU 4) TaxID=761193 RepID=A0A7U3ZR44_RUNSL|nr:DUF4105 domain-containing protein [Runella slithyformis]AEI51825.1 hypothetical protein Runsl_5535 [Runella slithyformis DSM 19594]
MAVKITSCLSIFYFIFFTLHSPLYAQSLSPDAKVSLITIAPGSSVFEGSGFGHSSLWVYDPLNGISKNYNYGTFTFQTGNFLLKFVQGTLPYTLSVAPMEYVVPHYEAERRDMTEQVLNLSQNQKQRLYDFLENNALPENREYKYRFFFDNCSSRIRDVLQVACGDSLVYYNKPIDGEAKSFRQWMNEYLVHKPWEKFLMNLGIGLPSDAIATPQQEMYLPYNLMHHFDKATLGGRPLVRITQPLVTTNFSHREQPSQPWWLSPTMLFGLLTAFVVWKTQRQQKQAKISLIFDKVFFPIIGLAGWILFGLATATDHGVTEWNLHLLWALPLYFPLAFFLTGKKQAGWMQKFITLSLGLLIAYVLVVTVGSLFKGIFIGLPLEAWLLIFCLFYRLWFLRKRV